MAQSSKTMLREGDLLDEFTDLFASVNHMFGGYRPERHYLRGLARLGTPRTLRMGKAGDC